MRTDDLPTEWKAWAEALASDMIEEEYPDASVENKQRLKKEWTEIALTMCRDCFMIGVK